MKIVFTSSYKSYSKENTKNYTSNSNILVFLISVNIIFLNDVCVYVYMVDVSN